MSVGAILTASLAAACVGGFFLTHVILRRLRTRHPDTWAELGSPTLVLNNTISNSLRTCRFIWDGEYRVLDDPVLDRLGAVLRLYWIAYALLFAALLLFGAPLYDRTI